MNQFRQIFKALKLNRTAGATDENSHLYNNISNSLFSARFRKEDTMRAQLLKIYFNICYWVTLERFWTQASELCIGQCIKDKCNFWKALLHTYSHGEGKTFVHLATKWSVGKAFLFDT
jgi:hypothetical protein